MDELEYKRRLEDLQNAIILQAVNDYTKALKAWKKGRKYISIDNVKRRTDNLINECETFFNGQWYRKLTSVDPKRIIKECRRRAGVDYE